MPTREKLNPPTGAPDARNLGKRRVLAICAVAAAILIVFVLVYLWARNSVSNGVQENFTTTTNPFAHVDANQSSDENVAEIVDMNATNMNAAADLQTTPEPVTWDYINTFDQVRGGTIYHASVDSQNSAYFDFPYQGGSTLSMTVRKHPAYGDDVIFKISKGQFVCHTDDCTGTINFGAGAEAISLSEPDDNSSDTLFVTNGNYVIDRLKKAKRVIVELPFYQEGNRQFIFEMKTGLSWPPKGAEANPSSVDDDNAVAD